MSRLGSFWTEVCGWRVHARVSRDPVPPEAPIVVLVHGLGVSSRYMLPAARALAPHYRVYAPDLPGFGRSSKPRQALTVPELADALAAWMGRVGIGRAALIGNSMAARSSPISPCATRRGSRAPSSSGRRWTRAPGPRASRSGAS